MPNFCVVYGSWKLRHNEPLKSGEDTFRLHLVPTEASPSHHSLLLDLRGASVPIGKIVNGVSEWFTPSVPAIRCQNLGSHEIPLAAVKVSGETIEITHLLTRVEKQVSHLIKPPITIATCTTATFEAALRAACEANHLYLNNFECFYIKGMPDTELEQKFNIVGEYDYHLLNRQWYAALADRRIPGFAPQLGDEIEHWAYDNDFCRIMPNIQQVAGYVSIMYWSRKRKLAWNEPVVTFKKKLYKEDALERWERNYAEQLVLATPEETMAQFFGLPLQRLPSWRRTRYDMACEAIDSGNIFMINFEDSRVRDDRTQAGRLQQCEIEYLKTRGTPDETKIYHDLNALSEQVEQFMRSIGLVSERTNYSKLTFLEDYVRVFGKGITFQSAEAPL
jgi:hypothetical protein